MDSFDRVRRRSPYADPREYKSVQECNEYMLRTSAHADVTLLVGPENGHTAEIKAHSYILFSRCPVFGRLLAKRLESRKIQGSENMFKPTKNTKGMKETSKLAKSKSVESPSGANQPGQKTKESPSIGGVKLKSVPQKAAPPKKLPPARGSVEKKVEKKAPAVTAEVNTAPLDDVIVQADGVIRIKDVDPKSFEELLRYLYSEEVELNTENVLGLTNAAHKFRIYSLTEICQQFIKTKLEVTAENVLPLLAQAVPNKAQSLLEDCLDFIDDHPEICETAAFHSLPKPVLDAVYVHIME